MRMQQRLHLQPFISAALSFSHTYTHRPRLVCLLSTTVEAEAFLDISTPRINGGADVETHVPPPLHGKG